MVDNRLAAVLFDDDAIILFALDIFLAPSMACERGRYGLSLYSQVELVRSKFTPVI